MTWGFAIARYEGSPGLRWPTSLGYYSMGLIRLMLLSLVPALFAAEPVTIGLSAAGHAIEAREVSGKGPTVVAIGGLDGTPAPVPAASGIRLLAIPLVNPDKAKLIFPPSGT